MYIRLFKKTFFLIISLTFLFSESLVLAKGSEKYPLPEFTQISANQWINSAPLKVSDLKGKVLMLDIWTYGCWNCYRSIPWMLTLEERFGQQGFQIIGIHTPEFDHERERDNVIAKMQEFEISHPVMMDNNFSYWKALNNRYWPSFYIVDKTGNIRGMFIGETHPNTERANQMEALISRLLKE
ncbi:MAG: thioredoxin-like domain-containing protein [Pseudomonadota bacterium]